MQPHELGDVFDLLVRNPQPFEDARRDLRTHDVVAHERAVARGGARLADVVEQGAQPHEGVRWRSGYGEAGVAEYVMGGGPTPLDPPAGRPPGEGELCHTRIVARPEAQPGAAGAVVEGGVLGHRLARVGGVRLATG